MTISNAAHWVGEKILRIPFEETRENRQDRVTRGESIASAHQTDAYIDDEASVADWFRHIKPTTHDVAEYAKSLFPFVEWLPRYNMQWLIGDMVAGITVGAVVVPQSMAYARLARLPVQFGLYSSFVGVMLYWFFATSKDITIGPVAVMSLLVGNIVDEAAVSAPQYEGHVVASALAVIVGAIVFAFGLLRAGFIVDFIPLPAIAAFMTGSAINIAVGQVPALMGITGVNNREAPYKVFINVLRHLGRSNISAAMGLTALAMLYLIRFGCNTMAKKQPHRQKLWFFIATLRTAFVILLYTMISWLVNMNRRDRPMFSIIGNVPRGFQNMAVPTVTTDIITSFAGNIPVSVIVLLIEHIAISKSFGRVNGYTINPSQELIAIGITNIFGAFFGGYPATGSFSRTAIKSKAGVRTPLAGVITGIVVLLAIYLLKAVFFYIPNPSLSAVIIHAVGDLITPPATVYQFWRISPVEVVIFFAGVIVAVFSTIEIAIYTTVAASGALLLFRVAKADGEFLGRLNVQSMGAGVGAQNVYLPLEKGIANPAIPVEEPYPGVFIFRFTSNFLYPNAVHVTDQLTNYVTTVTKRTNPTSYGTLGERPWNMPGPRKIDPEAAYKDTRPTLKAIIIDFSAVRDIDVSSTQVLIDVRNQLDRHTSPEVVDWHFVHVNSPWTRRALASAGFGRASVNGKEVFSVAEVGDSIGRSLQGGQRGKAPQRTASGNDIDVAEGETEAITQGKTGLRIPVLSTDYPAFHLTIDEALHSTLHTLGVTQTTRASPVSSGENSINEKTDQTEARDGYRQ